MSQPWDDMADVVQPVIAGRRDDPPIIATLFAQIKDLEAEKAAFLRELDDKQREFMRDFDRRHQDVVDLIIGLRRQSGS